MSAGKRVLVVVDRGSRGLCLARSNSVSALTAHDYVGGERPDLSLSSETAPSERGGGVVYKRRPPSRTKDMCRRRCCTNLCRCCCCGRGSLCCCCPRIRTPLALVRLWRTVKSFDRLLVLVFVAHALVAYSHFVSMAVFVQYLSLNLGLDDIQASLLYSAYGMLATIFGIFSGLVSDQLGVFTCLIAGSFLSGGARLLYVLAPTFLSPSLAVMFCAGLVATVLPLAESLLGQACMIGVKRYAKTSNAPSIAPVSRNENSLSGGDGSEKLPLPIPPKSNAIEYSVSYMLQNVSAVVAYASIGISNAYIESEAAVNVASLTSALPPMLILLGVSLYGYCRDTYDIDEMAAKREDNMLIDDNNLRETLRKHRKSIGRCRACFERWRPHWLSHVFLQGEVGGRFARYLVLSLLLIGAKSVFRHLEATMPKYTQRMFYARYPYSAVMLINPLIIIVFSTPLQSVLINFDALRTIVVGTAVCALATLLASVPHEAALAGFVVIFSFGEIIWSPRLNDYIFQMAPKGHEGTFSSLAGIPVFMTKLPVGIMSGFLLDTYCPSAGSCHSLPLWGIIAATGAISPLGLLVAYRWITQSDNRNFSPLEHPKSRRAKERSSGTGKR